LGLKAWKMNTRISASHFVIEIRGLNAKPVIDVSLGELVDLGDERKDFDAELVLGEEEMVVDVLLQH
jgi:hypothetical protein